MEQRNYEELDQIERQILVLSKDWTERQQEQSFNSANRLPRYLDNIYKSAIASFLFVLKRKLLDLMNETLP